MYTLNILNYPPSPQANKVNTCKQNKQANKQLNKQKSCLNKSFNTRAIHFINCFNDIILPIISRLPDLIASTNLNVFEQNALGNKIVKKSD